jgi:hypothetical protein
MLSIAAGFLIFFQFAQVDLMLDATFCRRRLRGDCLIWPEQQWRDRRQMDSVAINP